MKRYHEELNIIKSRVKKYLQLNAAWRSYAVSNTAKTAPLGITPGKYRKSMRCGGCGRARCQVCHSDKFPKRTLTKQEQRAKKQVDQWRKFDVDN